MKSRKPKEQKQTRIVEVVKRKLRPTASSMRPRTAYSKPQGTIIQ